MFRSVVTLLESHYDQLINGLDPVKSVPNAVKQITYESFNSPPRRFNYHFAVPLVAISIAIIQGVIGIDQPLSNGIDFKSKNFAGHQVFPEQVSSSFTHLRF